MRKRLYSCIDRDGIVYRHWRTTEAEARHYATLVHSPWTMLVDGSGRIVATRSEIDG